MYQRYPHVGNHDSEQHLYRKGNRSRPRNTEWREHGQHGNHQHSRKQRYFVDHRVCYVAAAITDRVVPLLVVGQEMLSRERHRNREQDQTCHPQLSPRGLRQTNRGPVDPQQHQRRIAVPNNRFHHASSVSSAATIPHVQIRRLQRGRNQCWP